MRNKLELTKGTTLCRQGAFQVGAGDASCPFRCLTKPNRGVSNALALPWATPWLQPVVCTLLDAPNKTYSSLGSDRRANAAEIRCRVMVHRHYLENSGRESDTSAGNFLLYILIGARWLGHCVAGAE